MTDAGAPTDARGSSDVSDARVSDARGSSDVSDAGGRDRRGSSRRLDPDASGGDAGTSPYKGVANSPCGEMATLGATWFYNWTLSRGSCASPQFVPMLWGHTGNEQTPAGITNAINTLVSNGFTTVLGFNEPDTATQSNITVANAIALWPSFNNPAIRIGSPATSANAAGQTWFNDFMAQVNADTTGTLRVDFIAAHWYGWNAGSCEANAATLESYIRTHRSHSRQSSDLAHRVGLHEPEQSGFRHRRGVLQRRGRDVRAGIRASNGTRGTRGTRTTSSSSTAGSARWARRSKPPRSTSERGRLRTSSNLADHVVGIAGKQIDLLRRASAYLAVSCTGCEIRRPDP